MAAAHFSGHSKPSTSKDSDEKDERNRELRSILNRWRHPHGQHMPATLIWINHYVDADFMSVPGEIALITFNLQHGIPTTLYWTLIDPMDVPGYYSHVVRNMHAFGLPNPIFKQCDHYQQYNRIVSEMEAYLYSKPVPVDNSKLPKSFTKTSTSEDGTRVQLFCSKEQVASTSAALRWLYAKAGIPFIHEVLPFERLVVVLSLGGVEAVAEREDQWTLKDLTQALNTITVYSEVAKHDPSSVKYPRDHSLHTWTSSSISSGKSSYDSLRVDRNIERRASVHQAAHPNAMLGAFLFEQQVEDYLKISDFSHMRYLACPYHRDVDRLGSYLKEVNHRTDPENRPDNRIAECALLNAYRQVYLILDVLLINYGITPKSHRHFPMEGEGK